MSSMKNKMKDFIVKTGTGNYPVVYSGHKKRLSMMIMPGGRAVIISNARVFGLHGKRFMAEVIPAGVKAIPLMMGDGEQYKSQSTINKIYEQLFDIGVSRQDFIIAFGGGVVGDTAGFVAATFKRGLGFIQAPTTILAMVDSSIGGKVGINHKLGKNQIGAFYQPQAVLVDYNWINTLTRREIIDGMGEIVKTGYLTGRGILDSTRSIIPEKAASESGSLKKLIAVSMKFKAEIVARDTFDRGIRAYLNFGHTFAHAIEKVEGYRSYRHGAAVLAGLSGALYLSYRSRLMGKMEFEECLGYLDRFAPHLKPLKAGVKDYLLPMFVDKKISGRDINFVLLEKIGRPVVRPVKSEKRILEAIAFMKDYVNGSESR